MNTVCAPTHLLHSKYLSTFQICCVILQLKSRNVMSKGQEYRSLAKVDKQYYLSVLVVFVREIELL